MAPRVWNDFVALVCAHPILAGASLILFTPPFFPIVKYFSPLLISTALFMLALFTMGPKSGGSEAEGDGDGDGEGDVGGLPKRRGPDGGWMDWVRSIEESSLSFMSPRAKLKRENSAAWKGGASVSILDDASWAKGGDFSSYAQGESGVTEEESAASRLMQESVGNTFMPTLIAPSMLFKVDSQLTAAADRSIYDDMDFGEDGPDETAPELEDVDEPTSTTPTPTGPTIINSDGHGVQHPPMERLRIPNRQPSSKTECPPTDLDSSSSDLEGSKTIMDANARKGSLNASSADSPAVEKLSLSGKLHQMEKLSDFIDDEDTADQKAREAKMLQPTTDEQVQAVKDHLESFVQDEEPKEAAVPSSSSNPTSVAGESKGEISEAK